ncbi:single-stranded DNA-binding protein [Enterococcus sp. LJL90]
MLNNSNLIGRLTKEVDFKYTPTGKEVGTFTLAVTRNFKNAQGERDSDFINCVIWGKAAVTLAEHTTKGSLISVTGRLQSRQYENKENVKVFVTELIVENFGFLEPNETLNKRKSAKAADKQAQPAGNPQANTAQVAEEQPYGYDNVEPHYIDIPDSELPY